MWKRRHIPHLAPIMAGDHQADTATSILSLGVVMRGYHIRIVLNPENSSRASPTDPFIPASLFQPLPSHSPKSTLRRNTLPRPNLNKDYRLGPITIDWTDFDQMTSILHSGKKAKEHGRGVNLHFTLDPDISSQHKLS